VLQPFREPAAKNEQRTLTVIIFRLVSMLVGISYLVKVHCITTDDPGQSGYGAFSPYV
jgi:hypothetical protein